MPAASDWTRLELLKSRLHDFELRLPMAHERAIVEVAREALRAQITALAQRLGEADYWRESRRARVPA